MVGSFGELKVRGLGGAKVGEFFCAGDFSAGCKWLGIAEFGIIVQLASD
jgi:hypothetical protein